MPGSKATPAWKELFDGGVAIAAPPGLEELAGIPAKRGVFLLEGPAETPILLATAANIRSRMRIQGITRQYQQTIKNDV